MYPSYECKIEGNSHDIKGDVNMIISALPISISITICIVLCLCCPTSPHLEELNHWNANGRGQVSSRSAAELLYF